MDEWLNDSRDTGEGDLVFNSEIHGQHQQASQGRKTSDNVQYNPRAYAVSI